MNFNIRILYWRTPTHRKGKTIMTQRHTQILPLLINLSHQLAVMIFFSNAVGHGTFFGLLSPIYYTHLNSFFSVRCGPWPTSSPNNIEKKIRNRWKMCNFLKLFILFYFFEFTRKVIGALFFLVYLKYFNLFCSTRRSC